MALNSGELTAVVEELRVRSAGWRVKKIYQPSETDLVFSFSAGDRLLVSVHPRFGRMCLVEETGEMPEKPSPFAGLLRKHLVGKPIEGFDKEEGERLVRIRFAGYSLYCRLYVPGGYLLTDAQDNVVGVGGWKATPPLKAGDIFTMPPSRGNAEIPAPYDGSPSAAIESRYGDLIESGGFEEEKKTLLTAARAERKRLQKLIAAMEGDREKLERYGECQRWGDLCRTHFGLLKRGMSEAVLSDLATGEPVKIPLSPELGPAENIDLLYKKFRKYRTGMEKITSAIALARAKAEAEEAKIASLENAVSPEDLAAFRPRVAKAATAGKKQAPSGFRTLVSADGYEMLVGRSGRENDELVRKSNGNDLWFHVRDFPGSHVVVRTRGKTAVPFGTIAEAARLALKHSSRAKDGKGIVVYTNIKYVKKPKNAPPGKVLVTHEKTVPVKLDERARDER